MNRVKLADISEQVRGVAYEKGDVAGGPADGYLPVLRANNIRDGGLNFIDLVYVKANRISERQLIRAGDIVIAASSGSLSVVGKAAQARSDFDGGFGAFCKVVRPKPLVEPRYLGHFFRAPTYRRYISSVAAGANINNIRNEHIDNIELLLPPLPEQKRIAAMLDQASALLENHELMNRNLRALISSEFERSFGAVSETVTIGDIAQDTLIGLVRSAEEFGTNFSVPYVRMDAISTGGEYLPDKVLNTDVSANEIDRYMLLEGDLIFNTRNSRELVGKSAVFRGSREAVFNNNIMRIRLKTGWNTRFVDAYLRSRSGSRALEQRKSGTTSVWAVYGSRLQSLPVPRVPVDEQGRFGDFVDRLYRQSVLIARQRDYLAGLFASLQHRAFPGSSEE